MVKLRDTLFVIFYCIWILVGILCIFALNKYLSGALQASSQTAQPTNSSAAQQQGVDQSGQQIPIQPNQQQQQAMPPQSGSQTQNQQQQQLQGQQGNSQQSTTQAGPQIPSQ